MGAGNGIGNASGSWPPAARLRARRPSRMHLLGALLVVLAGADGGARPAERTGAPTARRIPALSAAEARDSRGRIDRGLAYLRDRQLRSSSEYEGSGKIGGRYAVAVTALSGLAALGAGIQPGEGPLGAMVDGCVNYLLHVARHPDGFLVEPGAEAEGGSRMHGHAYAMLFLSQVSGSLRLELDQQVTRVLRRGVLVIEQAQSREGGWYYTHRNPFNRDEASVTICALQALRAADNIGFVVDKHKVDLALSYVKRCQEEDGSFRYSLSGDERRSSFALTAAAVSTLNAAGVYESQELRAGLDYLRRAIGRFPRRPTRAVGDEFFYYGNLYAAQAFYQDGGSLWSDWYPSLRQVLADRQRSNGSWESRRFGDAYATAMSVLILEVPLGYLPILQR